MESLKLSELKSLAKERNVKGYSKMSKKSLLDALKSCKEDVCPLVPVRPEKSIEIDWDNVLKKTSETRLVSYGE
jgi:hypothetical protein